MSTITTTTTTNSNSNNVLCFSTSGPSSLLRHIEVKAAYGQIKRRFLIQVQPNQTYLNLLKQIHLLFSLPDHHGCAHVASSSNGNENVFCSCIRIQYEDDEGDSITVSSEEELYMAIQVQVRMQQHIRNQNLQHHPIHPLIRFTIVERNNNHHKKSSHTSDHRKKQQSSSIVSTVTASTSNSNSSITASAADELSWYSHTSSATFTAGTVSTTASLDDTYVGSVDGETDNDEEEVDGASVSSSESAKTRRNRKKKLAKKARIQAKKEEKERKMEQKKAMQMEKEKMKLQKQMEKELKKEELKIAKEQKRLEKELIKTDDFDLTKNWPSNIKYLYLDGNNMLFVCSTFRKFSCKRSTRHNTEQLLNAIALEFHNATNLMTTQVCYDKTVNMPQKYSGIDKIFRVTSAIPDFNNADDQLVAIALQHKQVRMLDYCMFVTTDKLLRKRLKDVDAKVASPGAWLKCVHKYLWNENKEISANLDVWTDSFITRLDLRDIITLTSTSAIASGNLSPMSATPSSLAIECIDLEKN